MPGSWRVEDFPFLNATNCRVTSECDNQYNCVAWAASDTENKWWPDAVGIGYWPPAAPREETLEAFIAAYRTLGYDVCENAGLEIGLEKVAIFGRAGEGSRPEPTHVARQLVTGEWTSKMGDLEDIVHSAVNDPRGPVYGGPLCYMSRRRGTSTV